MTSRHARLILVAWLAAACGTGPGQPEPQAAVPTGPVLRFVGFDAPFVAAGPAGPEGDITGANGTLRFTVSPPASWRSPPAVACTGTAGSACTCADAGGGSWACAHPFAVTSYGGGAREPQSVTVEASADPSGAASATLRWEADVEPPSVWFDAPNDRGCTDPGGLPVTPSTGAFPFRLDDVTALGAATCRLLQVPGDALILSGSCQSGGYPFANLAGGDYALEVRAADLAGNESMARTGTWRVDAQAPIVTFLHPGTLGAVVPDIVAPDQTPAGSFAVDEDASTQPMAFSCTVDGLDTPCSPADGYDLSALPEGRHTVAVTASDCAGNAGTWPLAFDVDRDGPVVEVEVIGGPPRRPTVRVVVADAVTNIESVWCRIDGLAWTACPVDGVPTPLRGLRLERTFSLLDSLPAGPHALELRAYDLWGHASQVVSLSVGDL